MADDPLIDTIAAIATAPGEAAISVVRLSGPAALAVADRVFRAPGPPPSARAPGTFAHGRAVDTAGAAVDDVLLLVFRAPHSYTGEDAVELQGHGGAASARRLLAAVLDAGARPAEPGEFTRRAFLNGRLDLLQAEAVLDLIRARSEAAARAAREQLDGHLSHSINDVYDASIAAAADLEATLDFTEDEIPESVLDALPPRLRTLAQRLRDLLSGWREGHWLREGARVVIAGPPNAGKSTLFNRLLGENRTIVHHQPGTTRDTIEESLVWNGLPIRLVDTAGLRETDCEVEREGVRRARAQAKQADVLLYVVDARVGLTDEDRTALQGLSEHCIIIFNKNDLQHGKPPPGGRVCSALTGAGISDIRTAMMAMLEVDPGRLSHASISERHRILVEQALQEMESAVSVLGSGQDGIALASDHLRTAIHSIGQITGRVYHDELLNAVFSRFCVGK